MKRTLLALFLMLLAATGAQADQLLMARSGLAFPEAMLALQEAISERGYTVSRVQRVDIGLTSSGYQTDKYRVVFFGKPEEIRALAERHPQLIPYLPIKVTIFAEGEDTLVVTANPVEYIAFIDDPEVEATIRRWQRDIGAILDTLRERGGEFTAP